MEKSIFVSKFIVHILDNNIGMPILSNELHPVNAEVNEFVGKHVEKLFADKRLKQSKFVGDRNDVHQQCMRLSGDEGYFVEATKYIAEKLYKIMSTHVDIPAADIIFAYVIIGETHYLAMLKLNYKTSYIHHVQNNDSGQVNSIIKQHTTLPTAGQKLEDAFIIEMESLDIKFIEGKYDLDGEKGYYLSPFLLGCEIDIPSSEKIKVLEKTANKIIDKYYGERELDKRVQFKNIVNENLEAENAVDVEVVAEKIFGHIPEVKETYLTTIAQKGLQDKQVSIKHELKDDYYKKQKLVTDTGIEINLPVSEFDNKDKIEFVNNPDGTLSILIKNVKSIKK